MGAGLSRNRRSIILRELAWLRRKDPRDESRPSNRGAAEERGRQEEENKFGRIEEDERGGEKKRKGIRTLTKLGPTFVRSSEKKTREMEIWKFESLDEFESWNFHRVERAEREGGRKEKEMSEICRQIRTLELPFDRAKKERVKIKQGWKFGNSNLDISIGFEVRDGERGERKEKEIYRQIRTLKLPSDRTKKERMEIWKFIRK